MQKKCATLQTELDLYTEKSESFERSLEKANAEHIAAENRETETQAKLAQVQQLYMEEKNKFTKLKEEEDSSTSQLQERIESLQKDSNQLASLKIENVRLKEQLSGLEKQEAKPAADDNNDSKFSRIKAELERKYEEKIVSLENELDQAGEDNHRMATEIQSLQEVAKGTVAMEMKLKAEEYEHKLLEQMEKSYKIAQRVQDEKVQREEVELTLERTREQMKSATQRAVDLTRVIEQERKNVRRLEIALERSKEHRIVYRKPSFSGAAGESEEDYDDGYSDNDFEDEDAGAGGPESNAGTSTTSQRKKKGGGSTRVEDDNTRGGKQKKKKSTKSKKKKLKRARSMSVSVRGKTDLEDSSHLAKTLEGKLKKARGKNVALFRRFADIKRARDAAETRDVAKSEQLMALSNHLEKMMALLRAEAAAKASAQEAVIDLEDQLAEAKAKTVRVLEEHAEEARAKKDEARRETMLAKQLELMDEKFNGLMRTHNFLRSKTEKEQKKLNTALHEMSDKLYFQTKRNDGMHAAKQNIFNNFLRIVQNFRIFNQLPLPSEVKMPQEHLKHKNWGVNHMHFDLQDCKLRDDGALAFINAFNSYAIEQARADVELDEVMVANKRQIESGIGLDWTRPVNKVIGALSLGKPQVTFSINLSFNGITDRDNGAVIRTLCRSLVASNKISEVDLRGNRIGRTGLRMILDALQYNRTIKAVDLSGNDVTDAHLTEYLNDSARAADKMPDLTLIDEPGRMKKQKIPSFGSGSAHGPQARLFRRNNTGDNRPSSAPPAPGRSAAAPFRVDTVLGKVQGPDSAQPAEKLQIKFPPRMSAVSAVQRVITDSMTKVVAKNPFRKPKKREDAIDSTPLRVKQVDKENGAESAQRSTALSAVNALRPKTAGNVLQKSASVKSNIRERRRLPPKRPISAETHRRMGLKPGEKERREAEARRKKEAAEKKRIAEEMPAVTEVQEGERPKFGGQYASEIHWHAFARARAGRYKSILKLLKEGLDVDAREPGTGDTMLMSSVASGNPMVVKTLLRRGAKVNARNNRGWTALHCAVGSDVPQPEITNILMDNGAKLEGRDAMGVTPLQLAVEQASDDIICRLIEGGADIKTQDDYGRSVMHRVAAVGDKATTDLILTLGAQSMLNVPDVDGRCPASYAERHDQFEFLKILQSKGAIMETKDIYSPNSSLGKK